jgi:hypothetical protein
MRPNYLAVRKMLLKHFELMKYSSTLSEMGIEVEILENIDLLDIAMDFIGFPQVPEDGEEEEDIDAEDGFTRDRWDKMAYDYFVSETDDIDSFVLKLYEDCDHLILHHPNWFVRKD